MERNIKLLPLDKNMNGQLEYFENIYNDLSDFGRGVWIGKYPKRLSTTIYSLSSSKSLNKAETAFLSWVITDGQKFLNPAGFNDIVTSSRNASNLAALAQVMPKSDTVSGTGFFVHKLHDLSIFSMIVIGLLPFIIAFMIIDAVIRNKKVNQPVVSFAGSPSSAIFDENSVEGPKGLYYDKSHSWAFMEKNGAVRIGLDDFLQHVTGPLTRIIMKNPGEKVKKGESLFSIIQNGKKLTIHSPLTGIIRDQNSKLATDSSMLNSSPYFD
jgi:glycine cleavage system H lipoate-binding protein